MADRWAYAPKPPRIEAVRLAHPFRSTDTRPQDHGWYPLFFEYEGKGPEVDRSTSFDGERFTVTTTRRERTTQEQAEVDRREAERAAAEAERDDLIERGDTILATFLADDRPTAAEIVRAVKVLARAQRARFRQGDV